MGSTRRSFTEEYKEEAVNFVIEGGRSVAEVARNIGVHEMTLGRWVRKAKDAMWGASPASVVAGLLYDTGFGEGLQSQLFAGARGGPREYRRRV